MLQSLPTRRPALASLLPCLSQQVRYRKRKTVEVLLARDRPGLGQRGDTVNVAPGFARHRLLPRGEAVRTVLKDQVAEVRAQLEAEAEAERAELRAVARSIGASSPLAFSREATESGRLAKTVTAADIASALANDFGLDVSAASVSPKEVDSAGEHDITVLLGRVGVPATMRISIAPIRRLQ
jgi:large subunit ribosomal protein L9